MNTDFEIMDNKITKKFWGRGHGEQKKRKDQSILNMNIHINTYYIIQLQDMK